MNNQRSNSGAPAPDYEVFLNFRGKDTRDDLIDILRHFMVQSGIRFFYDDKSMRLGDEITNELIRGIERSQVYILMLSKEYANSKSCLQELAHMVNCHEEQSEHGRKVILPVFCGVSVDDVKLKEGSSYITELEKLGAQPERPDWEKALKKVAKIKGLHKGNIGAVDFSQIIVREVKSRIKMRPLSYHTVGIDEQAHEVEDKLDVESGDVRFLVIYGKGGMGKTTLARAVFQRLSAQFQGSSFISDVPEMEKRYSFKYLQNKLLRDIYGDDGTLGDIKESFRDRKVLIVLDGVDQRKQIDKLAGSSTWFGPGSRIIITTSCQEVLSTQPDMYEWKSNPPTKVLGFEMSEMKFDQAFKLFSRYAFWQDSVLKDFEVLSINIVQHSKRLPLILEIMGSLLHRERRITEWEKITQRFKESESVQGKLMISLNELQPSARKIFLDIACFFVNEEKTKPVYMWNTPSDAEGIEALLMLSLVKIVDGNKLWMHDCLRDLGREIVRQNCLLLTDRSRFWEHGEALQVLRCAEEQQKVEAICLHYYERQTISLELTPLEFSRKPMLRFLKLYSTKFQGDFRDHLRELRWLSWHYSHEDFGATHFASAALVILDLSRSSITAEWDGWKQLEEENSLKLIDLTRCEKLTKTPRFSPFQGLERVILEDCTNLAEIDCSIGELKDLKCLNIRGCDCLGGLPEQICSIEKLEEILVRKKVRGRFSLPSEIGSLKSLTTLEIVNVEMAAIPPSIGSLEKLQRLSLLSCSGFEELPESVGNLRSLAELQISETQVVRLPESIGSLKELKVIKMEGSSIMQLPHHIVRVKKLEELHGKNCKLTGEIPQGIKNLRHLKVLELSNTLVSKLPKKISRLSHLQKLKLPSCCELQNLSKLPRSLTDLGITFQAPPQNHKLFAGLTKLEKLELRIPENTICIPPFQFPPQLKSLQLSCQDLQCCLELPANLSKLILEKAEVGTASRHFNNLRKLSSLELHGCQLSDDDEDGSTRQENKKLDELDSLMHFSASECNFQITNGLHLPKDLRVLYINDSSFQSKVLQLSGLKSLKQLEISECKGLVEVEGLGELASLEELKIHSCSSLKRLGGDISKSTRLKVFRVFDNNELQELVMLDEAVRKKLKCFEVVGCKLPPSCRSSSTLRSSQGQCSYGPLESMRLNSPDRGKLDTDKRLFKSRNQRFKRYRNWNSNKGISTKRSRTVQLN